MARPTDWHEIGLSKDPAPGNADAMAEVARSLYGLRDTAGDVDGALATILATTAGRFVGKTADAIREKIDGRVREFVGTLRDALTTAGDAMVRYSESLRVAQGVADRALDQGRALAKGDPMLQEIAAAARRQEEILDDGRDYLRSALRSAGAGVTSPISACDEFWQIFNWILLALSLPAAIFGGVAMYIFLVASVVALAGSIAMVAQGKAPWWQILMAGLNFLFPSTRGLLYIVQAYWGSIKGGFLSVVNGLKLVLTHPGVLFPSLAELGRLLNGNWLKSGWLWLRSGVAGLPAWLGGAMTRSGLVVVDALKGIPGFLSDFGKGVVKFGYQELGDWKWTRFFLLAEADEVIKPGLKGMWEANHYAFMRGFELHGTHRFAGVDSALGVGAKAGYGAESLIPDSSGLFTPNADIAAVSSHSIADALAMSVNAQLKAGVTVDTSFGSQATAALRRMNDRPYPMGTGYADGPGVSAGLRKAPVVGSPSAYGASAGSLRAAAGYSPENVNVYVPGFGRVDASQVPILGQGHTPGHIPGRASGQAAVLGSDVAQLSTSPAARSIISAFDLLVDQGRGGSVGRNAGRVDHITAGAGAGAGAGAAQGPVPAASASVGGSPASPVPGNVPRLGNGSVSGREVALDLLRRPNPTRSDAPLGSPAPVPQEAIVAGTPALPATGTDEIAGAGVQPSRGVGYLTIDGEAVTVPGPRSAGVGSLPGVDGVNSAPAKPEWTSYGAADDVRSGAEVPHASFLPEHQGLANGAVPRLGEAQSGHPPGVPGKPFEERFTDLRTRHGQEGEARKAAFVRETRQRLDIETADLERATFAMLAEDVTRIEETFSVRLDVESRALTQVFDDRLTAVGDELVRRVQAESPDGVPAPRVGPDGAVGSPAWLDQHIQSQVTRFRAEGYQLRIKTEFERIETAQSAQLRRELAELEGSLEAEKHGELTRLTDAAIARWDAGLTALKGRAGDDFRAGMLRIEKEQDSRLVELETALEAQLVEQAVGYLGARLGKPVKVLANNVHAAGVRSGDLLTLFDRKFPFLTEINPGWMPGEMNCVDSSIAVSDAWRSGSFSAVPKVYKGDRRFEPWPPFVEAALGRKYTYFPDFDHAAVHLADMPDGTVALVGYEGPALAPHMLNVVKINDVLWFPDGQLARQGSVPKAGTLRVGVVVLDPPAGWHATAPDARAEGGLVSTVSSPAPAVDAKALAFDLVASVPSPVHRWGTEDALVGYGEAAGTAGPAVRVSVMDGVPWVVDRSGTRVSGYSMDMLPNGGYRVTEDPAHLDHGAPHLAGVEGRGGTAPAVQRGVVFEFDAEGRWVHTSAVFRGPDGTVQPGRLLVDHVDGVPRPRLIDVDPQRPLTLSTMGNGVHQVVDDARGWLYRVDDFGVWFESGARMKGGPFDGGAVITKRYGTTRVETKSGKEVLGHRVAQDYGGFRVISQKVDAETGKSVSPTMTYIFDDTFTYCGTGVPAKLPGALYKSKYKAKVRPASTPRLWKDQGPSGKDLVLWPDDLMSWTSRGAPKITAEDVVLPARLKSYPHVAKKIHGYLYPHWSMPDAKPAPKSAGPDGPVRKRPQRSNPDLELAGLYKVTPGNGEPPYLHTIDPNRNRITTVVNDRGVVHQQVALPRTRNLIRFHNGDFDEYWRPLREAWRREFDRIEVPDGLFLVFDRRTNPTEVTSLDRSRFTIVRRESDGADQVIDHRTRFLWRFHGDGDKIVVDLGQPLVAPGHSLNGLRLTQTSGDASRFWIEDVDGNQVRGYRATRHDDGFWVQGDDAFGVPLPNSLHFVRFNNAHQAVEIGDGLWLAPPTDWPGHRRVRAVAGQSHVVDSVHRWESNRKVMFFPTAGPPRIVDEYSGKEILTTRVDVLPDGGFRFIDNKHGPMSAFADLGPDRRMVKFGVLVEGPDGDQVPGLYRTWDWRGAHLETIDALSIDGSPGTPAAGVGRYRTVDRDRAFDADGNFLRITLQGYVQRGLLLRAPGHRFDGYFAVDGFGGRPWLESPNAAPVNNVSVESVESGLRISDARSGRIFDVFDVNGAVVLGQRADFGPASGTPSGEARPSAGRQLRQLFRWRGHGADGVNVPVGGSVVSVVSERFKDLVRDFAEVLREDFSVRLARVDAGRVDVVEAEFRAVGVGEGWDGADAVAKFAEVRQVGEGLVARFPGELGRIQDDVSEHFARRAAVWDDVLLSGVARKVALPGGGNVKVLAENVGSWESGSPPLAMVVDRRFPAIREINAGGTSNCHGLVQALDEWYDGRPIRTVGEMRSVDDLSALETYTGRSFVLVGGYGELATRLAGLPDGSRGFVDWIRLTGEVTPEGVPARGGHLVHWSKVGVDEVAGGRSSVVIVADPGRPSGLAWLPELGPGDELRFVQTFHPGEPAFRVSVVDGVPRVVDRSGLPVSGYLAEVLPGGGYRVVEDRGTIEVPGPRGAEESAGGTTMPAMVAQRVGDVFEFTAEGRWVRTLTGFRGPDGVVVVPGRLVVERGDGIPRPRLIDVDPQRPLTLSAMDGGGLQVADEMRGLLFRVDDFGRWLESGVRMKGGPFDGGWLVTKRNWMTRVETQEGHALSGYRAALGPDGGYRIVDEASGKSYLFDAYKAAGKGETGPGHGIALHGDGVPARLSQELYRTLFKEQHTTPAKRWWGADATDQWWKEIDQPAPDLSIWPSEMVEWMSRGAKFDLNPKNPTISNVDRAWNSAKPSTTYPEEIGLEIHKWLYPDQSLPNAARPTRLPVAQRQGRPEGVELTGLIKVTPHDGSPSYISITDPRLRAAIMMESDVGDGVIYQDVAYAGGTFRFRDGGLHEVRKTMQGLPDQPAPEGMLLVCDREGRLLRLEHPDMGRFDIELRSNGELNTFTDRTTGLRWRLDATRDATTAATADVGRRLDAPGHAFDGEYLTRSYDPRLEPWIEDADGNRMEAFDAASRDDGYWVAERDHLARFDDSFEIDGTGVRSTPYENWPGFGISWTNDWPNFDRFVFFPPSGHPRLVTTSGADVPGQVDELAGGVRIYDNSAGSSATFVDIDANRRVVKCGVAVRANGERVPYLFRTIAQNGERVETTRPDLHPRIEGNRAFDTEGNFLRAYRLGMVDSGLLLRATGHVLDNHYVVKSVGYMATGSEVALIEDLDEKILWDLVVESFEGGFRVSDAKSGAVRGVFEANGVLAEDPAVGGSFHWGGHGAVGDEAPVGKPVSGIGLVSEEFGRLVKAFAMDLRGRFLRVAPEFTDVVEAEFASLGTLGKRLGGVEAVGKFNEVNLFGAQVVERLGIDPRVGRLAEIQVGVSEHFARRAAVLDDKLLDGVAREFVLPGGKRVKLLAENVTGADASPVNLAMVVDRRFPFLRTINAGGTSHNCHEGVKAVDEAVRGGPVRVVGPAGPLDDLSTLEEYAGRPFVKIDGYNDLAARIAELPDGSCGFVDWIRLTGKSTAEGRPVRDGHLVHWSKVGVEDPAGRRISVVITTDPVRRGLAWLPDLRPGDELRFVQTFDPTEPAYRVLVVDGAPMVVDRSGASVPGMSADVLPGGNYRVVEDRPLSNTQVGREWAKPADVPTTASPGVAFEFDARDRWTGTSAVFRGPDGMVVPGRLAVERTEGVSRLELASVDPKRPLSLSSLGHGTHQVTEEARGWLVRVDAFGRWFESGVRMRGGPFDGHWLITKRHGMASVETPAGRELPGYRVASHRDGQQIIEKASGKSHIFGAYKASAEEGAGSGSGIAFLSENVPVRVSRALCRTPPGGPIARWWSEATGRWWENTDELVAPRLEIWPDQLASWMSNGARFKIDPTNQTISEVDKAWNSAKPSKGYPPEIGHEIHRWLYPHWDFPTTRPKRFPDGTVQVSRRLDADNHLDDLNVFSRDAVDSVTPSAVTIFGTSHDIELSGLVKVIPHDGGPPYIEATDPAAYEIITRESDGGRSDGGNDVADQDVSYREAMPGSLLANGLLRFRRGEFINLWSPVRVNGYLAPDLFKAYDAAGHVLGGLPTTNPNRYTYILEDASVYIKDRIDGHLYELDPTTAEIITHFHRFELPDHEVAYLVFDGTPESRGNVPRPKIQDDDFMEIDDYVVDILDGGYRVYDPMAGSAALISSNLRLTGWRSAELFDRMDEVRFIKISNVDPPSFLDRSGNMVEYGGRVERLGEDGDFRIWDDAEESLAGYIDLDLFACRIGGRESALIDDEKVPGLFWVEESGAYQLVSTSTEWTVAPNPIRAEIQASNLGTGTFVWYNSVNKKFIRRSVVWLDLPGHDFDQCVVVYTASQRLRLESLNPADGRSFADVRVEPFGDGVRVSRWKTHYDFDLNGRLIAAKDAKAYNKRFAALGRHYANGLLHEMSASDPPRSDLITAEFGAIEDWVSKARKVRASEIDADFLARCRVEVAEATHDFDLARRFALGAAEIFQRSTAQRRELNRLVVGLEDVHPGSPLLDSEVIRLEDDLRGQLQEKTKKIQHRLVSEKRVEYYRLDLDLQRAELEKTHETGERLAARFPELRGIQATLSQEYDRRVAVLDGELLRVVSKEVSFDGGSLRVLTQDHTRATSGSFDIETLLDRRFPYLREINPSWHTGSTNCGHTVLAFNTAADGNGVVPAPNAGTVTLGDIEAKYEGRKFVYFESLTTLYTRLLDQPVGSRGVVYWSYRAQSGAPSAHMIIATKVADDAGDGVWIFVDTERGTLARLPSSGQYTNLHYMQVRGPQLLVGERPEHSIIAAELPRAGAVPPVVEPPFSAPHPSQMEAGASGRPVVGLDGQPLPYVRFAESTDSGQARLEVVPAAKDHHRIVTDPDSGAHTVIGEDGRLVQFDKSGTPTHGGELARGFGDRPLPDVWVLRHPHTGEIRMELVPAARSNYSIVTDEVTGVTTVTDLINHHDFVRFGRDGRRTHTGVRMRGPDGKPLNDGFIVTPEVGKPVVETAKGTPAQRYLTSGGHGQGYRVTDTAGVRNGEYRNFAADGRIERQTFNVVHDGKVTGESYVADFTDGQKWYAVDATGVNRTGVFGAGKVDLTGAAHGRITLLTEQGATVFERRALATGTSLDMFRRVGGNFGYFKQRPSWHETNTAGVVVDYGHRRFDSAGTMWTDVSDNFRPTFDFRKGIVGGTGHDLRVKHQWHRSFDRGDVLATKGPLGTWEWHRYDKDFADIGHGIRTHQRRGGYVDTVDGADGPQVAQRQYGKFYLPNHAFQYREHTLVNGMPEATWKGESWEFRDIGGGEILPDGSHLKVTRWSEQRPPHWVRKHVIGIPDDVWASYPFLRDDTRFTIFTWTRTANDGTVLDRGFRFRALDSGGTLSGDTRGGATLDISATGIFARSAIETQYGGVVRVGDTVALPDGVPARVGHLPWTEGPGKRSGHRVDVRSRNAPDGRIWEDRFTTDSTSGDWYTPAEGIPWKVARAGYADGTFKEFHRPLGTEIKGVADGRPPSGESCFEDVGGDRSNVWARKDLHGLERGVAEAWPDGRPDGGLHIVEGSAPASAGKRNLSGFDARTDSGTWSWTDNMGNSGVREFPGRIYDPGQPNDWSYRDYQIENGAKVLVRDKRMHDDGSYIQAWRVSGEKRSHWEWRKVDKFGNEIAYAGDYPRRQWFQPAADGRGGEWVDQWVEGVTRFRDRIFSKDLSISRITVREIPKGEPVARVREYWSGGGHVPSSGSWKEFDHGTVVRDRKMLSDGTFLETDYLLGQWRQYTTGNVVIARRNEMGYIHEGRPGHRLTLTGRDYDYLGSLVEYRMLAGRVRDPNRMPWSDAGAGSQASASYQPYWKLLTKRAIFDFAQEFVLDSLANLMVYSIIEALVGGKLDGNDVGRAFALAAAGSGVRTGLVLGVHYNRIRKLYPLGIPHTGLSNLDAVRPWSAGPLDNRQVARNDWGAVDAPPRWRTVSYEYAFGLAAGAVAGFVTGAMWASIFGYGNAHGQLVHLSGADALQAGAISAATGFVASAPRAVVWTGSTGRVFERGGFGDLALQLPWRIPEKLFGWTVWLSFRESAAPSYYTDIAPDVPLPRDGERAGF